MSPTIHRPMIPSHPTEFLEAFRAQLAAANPVSDIHGIDGEALKSEIAAAFANITPMSREKHREHVFATQIADRLRDFQFEERYRRIDQLAGQDPRCRLQEAALRTVKERFQNMGSIVALVGPRGTGKTSIAAQLAQDRLWEDWECAISGRRGAPCRVTSYRKISGLLTRLKPLYADFGSVHTERMQADLDHVCTVEVLVIDEIHEVPEDSKFKDRILTDIVDRRYAAKRDTLLISNQQKQEFLDALNPSVVSRLREHGTVIRCEWPSFREKPAL